MDRLTPDECDFVAQAIMSLHGEMPPELGESMTPTMLSIIKKLNLKPAIARAAEALNAQALRLAEARAVDGKARD